MSTASCPALSGWIMICVGALSLTGSSGHKWQMLGVSVISVAEKCETAVARLKAVLTSLGVDSVNSLRAHGDRTRNSLVNEKASKDQRPSGSAPHNSRL